MATGKKPTGGSSGKKESDKKSAGPKKGGKSKEM